VTDAAGLARSIDQTGGINIGDRQVSGRTAVGYLSAAQGATLWKDVLQGWLASGPSVRAEDFQELDDLDAVAGILGAAGDATVQPFPTEESPSRLLVPAGAEVQRVLAQAFGSPTRTPVRVIVLNGSGAPGVGERVAERLIPAGFQIVASENAASFNHARTSIVASDRAARGAAAEVRQLLGVGDVTLGPSSNLGEVTIVVGEDFTSG